jgi:DNA-binding CsgD family transcriptional regulator
VTRVLWQPEQLGKISAALDAARGGQPTVLSVLGEPGMGKTSLLREIATRSSGFNVLEADGRESAYREPFDLLRQLGVRDALIAGGIFRDPVVVTQGLRGLVDTLSPSGPVLILIDDLQWADQESVESLYWLVHRAHGDRLLAVFGSRPEGPGGTGAWRRLMQQASRGPVLSLTGLSFEQATAAVLAVDPSAGPDAIRRLWDHCGRSPFHLDSLLRQYGFAELATMRSLPAPSELAARTKAELSRYALDVVDLVHASAVLGYSWQALPKLASVGQVADPAGAREALVEAGLLVARMPDMPSPLRTSHALARAAIYQSIPYARRRQLHLRAAGQAGNVMESLEHRVAAADHYDEALAAELEQAAQTAHAAGDFRQAGQMSRWASELSDDAVLRNRRWLDAVVDMILARDVAWVRQQLPAIQSAPDLARRAVIQGLMFGVEKRWLDAWATYTSVSGAVVDQADSVVRYRLLVLTAWSMICAGRDLEELARLLTRASDELTPDRALIGNEIFARGMLSLRRRNAAALDETLNSIPARSSDTPLQLTYKLAWRGSVHAFWGNAAASEADLTEVTTRIRNGVGDNSDGIYNGLLAFARWQNGSWNLADAEMRIALDHVVEQPHPMLRAIVPMLHAGRGDFDQADKELRQAADVLQIMPWHEPVHLYVISYVARLHAGADPAARKTGLRQLRAVFGDSILTVPGFTGALWVFHLVIAAIWAGDLDLAGELIRQGESQPHPPHWMAWVLPWVRGLAAETAGAIEQARLHLDAAIAGFTDDLPLYRAHALADHARVAASQHDLAAARRSLDTAGQLYRVLGAVPYLSRLYETADPPSGSRVEVDVLSALSDRERDVATLLVSGLTYAQIARDLYVTRATVGFHTGRIYAKTGVTSRAELIDLVRSGTPGARN